MRLSVLLILLVLVGGVFSITLTKKGNKPAKKSGGGGAQGKGKKQKGDAPAAEVPTPENVKAEQKADAARETVEAAAEETRAADAALNGDATPDSAKEAAQTKAYLDEQTQCNIEMRNLPRRTAEEVARARGTVRETDIIIPVPKGPSGIAELMVFQGALVQAGCRVTDHWCAQPSKCYFRTCFCTPVNAEAAKASLVQAEAALKKTDAKLAVDAQIVKEAEVAALDKGENSKAKKLKQKEVAIETKLSKDAQATQKLGKAEDKVDQGAAQSNPATACPPGYRLVTLTAQPICKKESFQGVAGFENPAGNFGGFGGFNIFNSGPQFGLAVPAGYGGLTGMSPFSPGV